MTREEQYLAKRVERLERELSEARLEIARLKVWKERAEMLDEQRRAG